LGLSLYAGFLVSWAVLYAGAAAFSSWAGRRPLAQSGLARLVLVCVVLTVSTAADAVSLVTTGRPSHFLRHVADATSLVVPLLFVEFFRARHPKRLVRDGAFWTELTLVTATTGGTLAGAVTDASWADRVSRAGALVLAASVLLTVLRIGVIVKRERALGPSAFVGGLLLAVFAVYDAVVALSTVGHVSVIHAGFALFAVAFFAGQIARIELLREDLMREKESLRAKSDRVTSAFRDLRVRQDELVRKEQLAAVGELAAVIAHEVRNPLAIIKNAVSSLRRRPEDTTQTATLCTILDEESTRLNRIVGDLLHYAKPLSVTPQNVDVADIVQRAASHLREQPNVDLELTIERSSPVVGDAVLVRQAIDNVLHNAVQAMGSGGTLFVGVRDRRTEPDGVEVTIRDTGEGMDTVVRRRALDPFFTTRPTGTGLGLAIVARVVEAHGGQLTILSERGAGTEVRIFLPRSSEESEPRVKRRLLATIEAFRSSSRPDSEDTPPSQREEALPPSAP
jgi:signal transduction histidine kinase